MNSSGLETDAHEMKRLMRRTIPDSARPAPISNIAVTPLFAIHSIDSLQRTTPVTCSTSKLRISSGSVTACALTLETKGMVGYIIEIVERASFIFKEAGAMSSL